MLTVNATMQPVSVTRRRRPKFRNCVASGMTFLTGMCIGVLLPCYLLYPPALQNAGSNHLDFTTNDTQSNTSDHYLISDATNLISFVSNPPVQDHTDSYDNHFGGAKERTTFLAMGSRWPSRTPFPAIFSGSERVVPSTSSDQYIHEPGVDALLPATAATERPVAPGRTSRASFSGMRRGLPVVQRRPNSTAAADITRHAKFRKSNPDPRGWLSTIVAGGPAASSTDDGPQKNASFAFTDFVDGVFWTEMAEKLTPLGFGNSELSEWRRFVNVTPVLKVQDGCGRMQNRLVTFDDGKKSCCRYRHNNDQIQGEIFSFYLGRLLGISNLVPSALALVDTRETRWSAAASQVSLAQWSSERPVVLTQFVEDLRPALIPKHFQVKGQRRLHPIKDDLDNLTMSDIADLVQWSDLIIFDYLTANLDRVVNNMYNERWNPEMMRQPAHNLARTKDGLLLFLDNESGLLHGYRLLEKYENFHQSLLDGLCLFRESTAKAISHLFRKKSIEEQLKTSFFEGDPGMSDWLPFLPEKSIRTLKKRLSAIYDHISSCRSRFGPPLQSDDER